MTNVLLASLLAAPAGAQAVLAPVPFGVRLAEVRSEAVPGIDDVLARLADASDIPGQLSALAELGRRAGGLDPIDQHRVAAALSAAAASDFNAGTVRGRALDALGKAGAWLGDEAARAEAVRTLVDYAGADSPADARTELRTYALRALASSAARLPPADDALHAAVAGCALDGLSRAGSQVDRDSAVMLLEAYLRANGPGILFRSWDLRGRFEAEVLAGLEAGGLDRLYDQPQANLEYRYFLIRSLAVIGRSYGGPDLNLPHRALGVLREMAQREPDPRLRRLAELYSRRVG